MLFICGIDDDGGTYAATPTRGSPLDSRGEMTVEVSRERRIDSACIVLMMLLMKCYVGATVFMASWGYWRGVLACSQLKVVRIMSPVLYHLIAHKDSSISSQIGSS